MLTVGFDISGLDATFREHAARGIGRYVSELKNFFDTVPAGRVQVETFSHASFLASSRLSELIDKIPLGRRTLKQQILFPLKMSSKLTLGYDVVHFPAHMDAPSWCRKQCIITVLDLIPFILRDLYEAERPGLRFRIARWLECQAIKNAALVLAISENTAADVGRVLGIPDDRIVVTPLGVDQKFFSAELKQDEGELRKKYGIPTDRRILLYVGGIDPRKNWRGLFKVFSKVRGTCREQNCPEPVLVMAGKIQNDRQYPALLAAVKDLSLEGSVIMPGFVDDADLLQIYSISSVFCFLSLYEGFGLPPLEAMAAGTPVVSSNTSCMPEVLGDAALFVNPEDLDSASDQILAVLNNGDLASSLIERGRKQARLFPWSRTGEATIRAYEKFAGLYPE